MCVCARACVCVCACVRACEQASVCATVSSCCLSPPFAIDGRTFSWTTRGNRSRLTLAKSLQSLTAWLCHRAPTMLSQSVCSTGVRCLPGELEKRRGRGWLGGGLVGRVMRGSSALWIYQLLLHIHFYTYIYSLVLSYTPSFFLSFSLFLSFLLSFALISCLLLRSQGFRVSTNIAPSTATLSVVHNKQFAAAYGGFR